MMRSLYSGVSGLTGNQTAMDVIGNNIANVNTIGFKTSRAIFEDMLSQNLGSGTAPSEKLGGVNPKQVGTGTSLVAIDNIFTQGNFKQTQVSTDLAIDGNGFFIVKGVDSNSYYTRAGDFNFDPTGTLVNPSGFRVQGWMADPDTGQISPNTIPDTIHITNAQKVMPSKETTKTSFKGILSTVATASKLKYKPMLTQAGKESNIFNVKGYQGRDMDLDQINSNIVVRTHGTSLTGLGSAYTQEGKSLGLRYNTDNINIDFGSNVFQMTYGTPSAGNISKFETLGQFVTNLQTYLTNSSTDTPPGLGHKGATVEIAEGQIIIKNAPSAATPGSSNFEIRNIDIPANSFLENSLRQLKGQYQLGGSALKSGTMYFEKELLARTDFDSISSVASGIQNAIAGNVKSDFTATFMDNDFGLIDGKEVDFAMVSTDGAGTSTTTNMKFTYVNGVANSALNQFSTVKELSDLIRTNSGQELDTSMENGRIEIKNISTGNNINFSLTSSGGSDYLRNIFPTPVNLAPQVNHVYSAIEGKGRIVYIAPPNASGVGVTGLSITNKRPGSIFDTSILMGNQTRVDDQGMTLNGVKTSYPFLIPATTNTKMIDTFTDGGESCNFIEDVSLLDMTAEIGGTFKNKSVFNIGATTTIKDWMDAIESYLGLDSSFNNVPNVTMDSNGSINIVGEKGLKNNIDQFKVVGFPLDAMEDFNTRVVPYDKTSASGGYSSTDTTIFDEQGNMHNVKFEFSLYNSQEDEWLMTISTQEPGVTVAIDGATINELVVKFNSDGSPSYIYDRNSKPIKIITDPTMTLTPNNGTDPVRNIAISLGTPGKLDGIFTNAKANNISNEQDGYELGNLEDVNFDKQGRIIGYYNNSKLAVLGQVAMATFENNKGLKKIGGSLYGISSDSGVPNIGEALTGDRGQIASNSLELSNVDLSNEFVDMITTQRAFQANSRVITTSDDMIQELLTLKR